MACRSSPTPASPSRAAARSASPASTRAPRARSATARSPSTAITDRGGAVVAVQLRLDATAESGPQGRVVGPAGEVGRRAAAGPVGDDHGTELGAGGHVGILVGRDDLA